MIRTVGQHNSSKYERSLDLLTVKSLSQTKKRQKGFTIRFVILLQLFKISVKTSKESPHFEETTWLVLKTHSLNVQYVIK